MVEFVESAGEVRVQGFAGVGDFARIAGCVEEVEGLGGGAGVEEFVNEAAADGEA